VLRRAAVAATLAHSSRGAEPWRFEVRPDSLELYADPDRWLPAQDPTGQALTLSVGCALLNARAVLEAEGVEHKVLRLPDPRHPQHVSTVVVLGDGPAPAERSRGLARLADAGFERYAVDGTVARAIGATERAQLASAAAEEGAVLHQLDFDAVVVATANNRAVDWLVAGEAVQRLVLEAALLGLGAAEVECRLDLPAVRARLRNRLGETEHPQAVLRLGARGRKARGRRRSLADVLQ
jgi:nitroreductase